MEPLEERQLLTAVPVGPEFTVSAVTAGSLAAPQMAHDAAGNFIVVWEDTGGDGDGYGIFAQRYAADGTAAGGRVTVNTVTAGDQRAPSVAMNDSGQYVISWQNDDIFAQRFNADGSRDGGEFTVNTTTAGVQSQSSVGIDAAGDFAVAWRGTNAIYARRFNANGTAPADFGVARPSGFASSQTTAPQLAMNANGQFAVEWANNDIGTATVVRFAADAAQQGATNSYRLVNASIKVLTTALAMDAQGDLILVYSARDTTLGSAFIRISASGVSQGAPPNDIAAYQGGYSSLAADSAGNFAWVASLGALNVVEVSSGDAILGQAFYQLPQPLSQSSPVTGISLDNAGRITATWNTGQAIVARQYLNSTPMRIGMTATAVGEDLTKGASARIALHEAVAKFTSPPSALGGDSGPSSVTNRANWQLLKDGIDVSSLIDGITYDRNQATLHFSAALREGNYQLIAHDTLLDAQGAALDGDADGVAGGDYSTMFTVGRLFLRDDASVVSTSFGNPSGLAAVDADAAGNYIVAWSEYNVIGGPYRVMAQKYDNEGHRAGQRIQIALSSSVMVQRFDLALDADGTFLATWLDSGLIYFQRFDANGVAQGSAVPLGTASDSSPSIALDAAGNFVICWVDVGNVKFQRLDKAGVSIGSAQIINPGSPAQEARLAMNDAGRFVITWRNTATSAILVRIFDATGTASGNAFDVNASSSIGQGIPAVGIDAAGNFVVISNRLNVGIVGRRFDATGAPLGNEFSIANTTSLSQLAMSPDGEFFVTAVAFGSVQVQRYSADGQPRGAPLGYFAASYFYFVDLAVDGSGDVVAAWRNAVNPSIYSGVITQRFITDHAPVVDLNGNPPGVDYAGVLVPGSGPVPIVDSDQLFVSNPLEGTLQSVDVSIAGPLTGDLLAADTSGTAIVASFAAGVLTLSGTDSVEHYQQVLRTLKFAADPSRTTGDVVDISVLAHDGTLDSQLAHSLISIYTPGSASVADRHVFYNNSSFDGGDASANSQDDAAIATDKAALLPGQAATFANYTSFSSGLNGLMIDLAGTHGAVSLDDFTFKLGNNSAPDSWANAPTPTLITVRAGAGVSGSDRVELIWDAGIRNQWLQVTLAANAHTGLAQPDVFYFGNAAGDSGNSPTDAWVNVTDQLAVRNHATNLAAINNPYDYNRDGHVDSSDELWARNHLTNLGNALRLITVPGPIVVASSVALTPTAATLDPAAAIVLSAVGRIDATPAVPRLPGPENSNSVEVHTATQAAAGEALADWDQPGLEKALGKTEHFSPDDDWLSSDWSN